MSNDRKGPKNSGWGKKRPDQAARMRAKKGQTWEEMYGVEKAAEIRRKRSQYRGKKHHNYGKPSPLKGVPRPEHVKKKISKSRMGLSFKLITNSKACSLVGSSS